MPWPNSALHDILALASFSYGSSAAPLQNNWVQLVPLQAAAEAETEAAWHCPGAAARMWYNRHRTPRRRAQCCLASVRS